MNRLLYIFFICITQSLFAQFNFETREQELATLLDSLRAAKSDSAKLVCNDAFKKLLYQTLQEPTLFDLTFTKLKTVGIIDSPDGLVKIVNWNVEQDDQSQLYYAFVIHRDIRKNTHEVIELIDNSALLPAKPDDVLDAYNWYGALYYQIIPIERSNKIFYTVLGWDGGTTASNSKLIDVLNFSGNTVRLGSPIFKMGEVTYKRIFFEHSEKTIMSLKWEPQYNRIIFDHLSPETPSMTGFYEYYVPDMSYDAFIIDGNKWVLKEDVIGINPEKNHVVKVYEDPKTGEIVTETVDAKWVDPTTEGSPASSETHIAMTPDGEKTEKTKHPKSRHNTEGMTAQEIWDNQKHHKKTKGQTAIVKIPKRTKKGR
jgi:hypothetical protein